MGRPDDRPLRYFRTVLCFVRAVKQILLNLHDDDCITPKLCENIATL
jgi:hypothetical protein